MKIFDIETEVGNYLFKDGELVETERSATIITSLRGTRKWRLT